MVIDAIVVISEIHHYKILNYLIRTTFNYHNLTLTNSLLMEKFKID